MRSLFRRLPHAQYLPLSLCSMPPAPKPPLAPPVACAAAIEAPPAKLIESCTARDRQCGDIGGRPSRSDDHARAVALDSSGEIDKALAEIDAVIAKDPHRARAFRARGEILRQTGKSDAALEALNEAIRLDPDNANGYESRGNSFNKAGNTTAPSRTITRRCG